MHQVCAESYAVGYMDECCMAVVIQTDSYWALTAPSMTLMTLPTTVLLVNFISNLIFALTLGMNRSKHIEFFGHLTASSVFENFHMVCMTLAHAPMNTCVSQFGYWNYENSDPSQNWYTNFFTVRCDIRKCNLAVYSTGNAGVGTICSSESNFYMLMSRGGNMQW